MRIAEDAAVVDVISRGRLELVVAAGYVAAEFAMFGRSLADRPRLVEEGVEVLKHATALGVGGQLEFHPLAGGADPALGWSCLTLFD